MLYCYYLSQNLEQNFEQNMWVNEAVDHIHTALSYLELDIEREDDTTINWSPVVHQVLHWLQLQKEQNEF